MRDWQADPLCRGFRHLPFPFLASWGFNFGPALAGRTRTRAAKGPVYTAIPVTARTLFMYLAVSSQV
jgi:hypothetical protein